MLSATAYGLFFTISIIAIVVCILTLEKLWSKKERRRKFIELNL